MLLRLCTGNVFKVPGSYLFVCHIPLFFCLFVCLLSYSFKMRFVVFKNAAGYPAFYTVTGDMKCVHFHVKLSQGRCRT